MPRKLYEKLISLGAGGQIACQELWKRIAPVLKDLMPPENASVLYELSLLMKAVSVNSVRNGMPLNQLAGALVRWSSSENGFLSAS